MNRFCKRLIFMMVIAMVSFGSWGCSENAKDKPINPTDVEVPPSVQTVKDNVLTLAANSVLELNGEFADRFEALLLSEEGQSDPEYAELKAVLDNIRISSGAYYVYILVDSDPLDDYFEITVDGSLEPDDWMAQYDIEGQFVDALNGTPAAALSAWDNAGDLSDPVWSAFAPIYNTAGDVVGILGVDYPAPEVLDFPEWNRDAPQWNGLKY